MRYLSIFTIFMLLNITLSSIYINAASGIFDFANAAPDIPLALGEAENNSVALVIATDYQGAKLDQVKAKAKQLEQRASEKGIDLSTTFLTGKKEIVNQTVTRKKQNLVRYAYVNTYDYQYGSTVLKNRIPIEYDSSVKFEQDIYHTPEFPKGEAFTWARSYGDYGAGSGLYRDICWRRYNGSVYENWFQCYIPIQMYNPNNMSGTVINYEFITQNAHTYTQSYSSEYHYKYPDNFEPLSFYSMDVACPAQWSVKATGDSTYVEKVEALDFSKLDNTVRGEGKKYLLLLSDSKRDISFQYPFGQYYPFGSIRRDNVGKFCREATVYIVAPAEVMNTKMQAVYPDYISSVDKQDMSLGELLSASPDNKAYLPDELEAALENLLANALPKGKRVDVVIAANYQKERLTELNNQLNTMRVNALEQGIDLRNHVLGDEVKLGTKKVYAPRELYARNINVTYKQQITYERYSSGSQAYSYPEKTVTLTIPYETCDIKKGEALPDFNKSTNYSFTISEQKTDISYMNTSKWGTVVNKVERYYDLEIFDPYNKATTLVTYRLDSELTFIDLVDGGRDGFQSTITSIQINSLDRGWGFKNSYDKEYTSEVKAVDFSKIDSLGLRDNSRKYIIYLTSESDLPNYGDDFGDYYGFGALTKTAFDSYMSKYDFISYVAAPKAALDFLLSDFSGEAAYAAQKQDFTLQDILDNQPCTSMYYDTGSLKTALEDIVFSNGKHTQNKVDIITATDYGGAELGMLAEGLNEVKDALSDRGYDATFSIIDGTSSRLVAAGPYRGVNTAKVLEAASLADRSHADKIFITALKGEGNTASGAYGTYYGFGTLSGSFIKELVNNKFTTYNLVSAANLDYKLTGTNINLPEQSATLRDITINSVSGGGQNAGSLKQLVNRIINRYKPFREESSKAVYMVIHEDGLSASLLGKDYESDPIREQQWKIATHEPGVFENSQGLNSRLGGYLSSTIETALDKVGKYEIVGRIQDNPKKDREWEDLFGAFRKWSGDSAPITVYVHRRPVAEFQVSVEKDGGYCKVSIEDGSYDIDHMSLSNRGIVEYRWQYRQQGVPGWLDGRLPDRLPYGSIYDVRLQVKDMEGAWSLPFQDQIDTMDLPPSIDASPASYSGNGPLNITVTAEDNGEGDLVLAGSRMWPKSSYSLTSSRVKPAVGWISMESKVCRLSPITEEGTYYLHLQAVDTSGKAFYRLRGPYTIEAVSAEGFYITMLLDAGWRDYYFDTSKGVDVNHDGEIDLYQRRADTDIGTVKLPVNYFGLVAYPKAYVKAGYRLKGKIELKGKPDWAEFKASYEVNGKKQVDTVSLKCEGGQLYTFDWLIPQEADDSSFVKFDIVIKKGENLYGNEKWEDEWDVKNTSRNVLYIRGKAADDLIFVQSH